MSGKIVRVALLFTIILMTANGATSIKQQANVIHLQVHQQESSLSNNNSPPLVDVQSQQVREIAVKAGTTPAAGSSTTVRTSTTAATSVKTTTSSPSYRTCGVANSNSLYNADAADSRIVGGDQAMPNEFPWQAFLQVEMISGKIYYCGGTLIADQWILTAARCLIVSGQTLKSVAVYLGVHDIKASYEANRKLYSGSTVFTHPDYNANNQAGDIAMIQLSTTVTYTQYIRPVCLATSNEPSYANSQVTVAGWGTTYDASTSLNALLRKVTVPVITNAECSSTYGSSVVTDKIICTSGANNRGICTGDGGGPMNFKQSDGTWKQIGIASFISTAGCQSGKPSGYTRLSSYSTWVQFVMSSNNSPTTTTPKPSSANSSFVFLSSVVVSINFFLSLLLAFY